MYLQKSNYPSNSFFKELSTLFNNDNYFHNFSYDIIENENNYEIVADLPGFNKEEINISTEDNQLTIEAEHKEKKEEEEKSKYIVRERVEKKVKRTFNLNQNVDPEKIGASYKNGVLKLQLPKKEKLQKKAIEIE